MPSQTVSGRAWEFGLARCIADFNEILIERNSALKICETAYHEHGPDQRRAIDDAALTAALFFLEHDVRMGDIMGISLQTDQRGRQGDVRDIVLRTRDRIELGISAKHRHQALKHSRVSSRIDFGKQWYGTACSSDYWERVTPVFRALEAKKSGRWSELLDKVERYYTPVMQAFMQELREHADPPKLLRYVVGRHDFYKAIKDNGSVKVQSFNLSGELRWGERLPLPTRIIEFRANAKRKAYAELTLDHGWALSFRLHNARTQIEPSLKFDIQLIGNPKEMGHYVTEYA